MKTVSSSPEETFEIGREIGSSLAGGDIVLLVGGLGAGKTLLTKGILDALDFDIDEVTSPSFSLVNLYRTPRVEVYHIDLWRISEGQDAASAVGLEEILDSGDPVTIVEWADRLDAGQLQGNVITITIEGEGDDPRELTIDDTRRRIVIRKSERKLEFHRGGTVESCAIALGFSPAGQKEREGDGRTPEGEFRVFAKNPKSGHHLSLAISYPDLDAAERGLAAGVMDQRQYDEIVQDLTARRWIPQETPLGGRIYIHGGGTASDWTDGCIALDDREMELLYEAAAIGTRVTILP